MGSKPWSGFCWQPGWFAQQPLPRKMFFWRNLLGTSKVMLCSRGSPIAAQPSKRATMDNDVGTANPLVMQINADGRGTVAVARNDNFSAEDSELVAFKFDEHF